MPQSPLAATVARSIINNAQTSLVADANGNLRVSVVTPADAKSSLHDITSAVTVLAAPGWIINVNVVVAGSGNQQIGAATAGQHVVAVAADQGVFATAAGQPVASAAAARLRIALGDGSGLADLSRSIEPVIAALADENVRAAEAGDDVTAAAAVEQVGAAGFWFGRVGDEVAQLVELVIYVALVIIKILRPKIADDGRRSGAATHHGAAHGQPE